MRVNDFGPGMVIYNVQNRGDHILDMMASSDVALHIRYHVATNVTIQFSPAALYDLVNISEKLTTLIFPLLVKFSYEQHHCGALGRN